MSRCKGPSRRDIEARNATLERENVRLRSIAYTERARADALRDYFYHQRAAAAAVLDLFSMARPTCEAVDLDDQVPF